MSNQYESGSKRASVDGREMDDVEARRSRQIRGDMHVDLRMLLPSSVAGAIIGRGGENIKRLRKDCNASITIPDCQGPERILSISAKLDVVCELLENLIPTISQQISRSEDNDHEVRLLIHQSHAGRVIGKGGTRIKELREESGCQIMISMDKAPNSSDRVVLITGSIRQITSCIGAMYEIFEGSKPLSVLPYDPRNADPPLAWRYFGYPGEVESNELNFTTSKGHVMNRMSSFMNGQRGGKMEKVTTWKSSIPKGLAGAILGKGGSRIKQVQQESGTKIKLDDASPDSAERIISITGTQEQIQYAQYLLQLTVKRPAGASP